MPPRDGYPAERCSFLLAIRTEDHPLDYLDFEGAIPKQEYGGGTVIVWDTGAFDNLTERSLSESLAKGRLKVAPHGQKLSGGYALAKINYSGRQEQWLLIKSADEGADRRRKPATTQLESVLTGRTNDDVE